MHEFATITGIQLLFDDAVPPIGQWKFANICIADGKKFEPAYAMTKKDARQKAAKMAFDGILGLAAPKFTIVGPSKLDDETRDDVTTVKSGDPDIQLPVGLAPSASMSCEYNLHVPCI